VQKKNSNKYKRPTRPFKKNAACNKPPKKPQNQRKPPNHYIKPVWIHFYFI
jgi:hypothetical protein